MRFMYLKLSFDVICEIYLLLNGIFGDYIEKYIQMFILKINIWILWLQKLKTFLLIYIFLIKYFIVISK